jgi:hypothetical protein
MLTFLVSLVTISLLFAFATYLERQPERAPIGLSGLISVFARLLRRPRETLDGYEQPELVEVIFQKTKAYKPDSDWPEMAGVSSVLDFGGGCGIHYKQANLPDVRWAVVETPAMVE